ncbi:hypothetical protein [Curtobacterium sp. VKM Ac-2887]|uniref:hypothetical protein n=1 Tax=Curtobacterium sp. VKM Ac-2887 TaxID=2783819 RepID=UPI00188BE0E1|nr:hypothetical protein [Curtobacterium sp. VKM Ac-2887]MBF4584791.1 hypothetical protein [Curtobacterium sp. VKM Ac-2887]
MTTPYRRSDHRGAAVLLTVLVVVCWVATIALPIVALSLMLHVEAPAERAVPIVIGWFMTPFMTALGVTIGLVILQRSRRSAELERRDQRRAAR